MESKEREKKEKEGKKKWREGHGGKKGVVREGGKKKEGW